VENLQSENSRLKDTIKTIEAELSKAKRELEETKSREKDTNMKNEKLMQKLKSTKGSPLYKTIFTRRPSDEERKRPKQSQVGPVPTIDESSHYSISSDLDPISLLETRTKTRRRGGGLTLKKSCSSPALASLGIPTRNDSVSLLKRLSVSGNSRLKKTHNSFINRSLHAMGRSTSSSSMLSLLSDDDDQQDRSRSSKSLMEASMHSCPEPSSTRPRKVSVPVHQDLADFNIIEENAKKTGEERLVTLNDINNSTVLVERNKAITVDSTEAKPAVDDKDLLIRTLEIKLLSRNETINSMEKTMLENIKNMQELHVAQINSMEKTTLENIKNMQELLVAQHGV
jgi:hypothetical protein